MSIIGHKTQLRRWNSVTALWVEVAKVRNLSGPTMSRDTIDDTAFDTANTYREFISGLRDAGEVTITLAFNRDGYEIMKTDFEDDTAQNYEIVLPDADTTSLEFEAFVTEMPLDVPLDDLVTVDVTFKITGQPNLESGSGPSAGA